MTIIKHNKILITQYSYMFLPPKVVFRLALEHFKKNIQIAFAANEISFLTQYTRVDPKVSRLVPPSAQQLC